MDGTIGLETERLWLRAFAEGDAPALYRILSDEKTTRFLPMFQLASMEEAKRFLVGQYLQNAGEYRYAVCLKPDPTPVGYVHVDGGESHDLGYALRRDLWDRGIITEAAGAVIDRLRADGVPFVTATHDVRNPRSGAVMKKIGMRYCYSYEEWWMPKNIPVTFRLYQRNLDENEGRVYRAYWDRYPVHFVEEGL